MAQTAQKHAEKWCKASIDTVVTHPSSSDVQPMANSMLGAA